MNEVITSYEARRGRLHNMDWADLVTIAEGYGLEVPTPDSTRTYTTVKGRLVRDILDKEYPEEEKAPGCACGETTLGWVHVPPGGNCWRYDPEGVTSETIEITSWEKEEAQVQLVQIWGEQIKTESGRHIVERILPEVLERFLAKNADYGDQHRDGLGPRAEYVGIHRKVFKLKSALWEGQEMNGEDAREMLGDLIGQCLIVLDLLDQEP